MTNQLRVRELNNDVTEAIDSDIRRLNYEMIAKKSRTKPESRTKNI